MRNTESQNLRYLISRGHNLCNDISDYTYGQILFMIATEEKMFNDKNPQFDNDLTIQGEGDPKEIKEKFALLMRFAKK